MNATRTKTILLLSTLSAAICTLFGCAALSGQTPPTQVERTFFDVKTNWIDVVRTNTVIETNQVTLTNTLTHEVTVSNIVTSSQNVTTNQEPRFSMTPSDQTKADTEAVGGIINAFLPGAGTIAVPALLGLFGLWGKMRSYKQAGAVMAGNVEAAREFIKTLPGGAAGEQAYLNWIVQNQAKLGAISQISKLVGEHVDNEAAKKAAEEIQNALAAATKK